VKLIEVQQGLRESKKVVRVYTVGRRRGSTRSRLVKFKPSKKTSLKVYPDVFCTVVGSEVLSSPELLSRTIHSTLAPGSRFLAIRKGIPPSHSPWPKQVLKLYAAVLLRGKCSIMVDNVSCTMYPVSLDQRKDELLRSETYSVLFLAMCSAQKAARNEEQASKQAD
jgi:hypothetical protein